MLIQQEEANGRSGSWEQVNGLAGQMFCLWLWPLEATEDSKLLICGLVSFVTRKGKVRVHFCMKVNTPKTL